LAGVTGGADKDEGKTQSPDCACKEKIAILEK
jgi:hypothetical protein